MGMVMTPNGFNVWECGSAFHKSIRRGLEKEAMYWAMEMEAAGFMGFVLSRLRTIAHEDIGLADMQAAMFAVQSADLIERGHPKSPYWRLALGNAVRALCRAVKSREGDHFINAVDHQTKRGPKLEMPDWAIDKHTQRGKAIGRGIEFFIGEGSKLVPQPPDDAYKAEAEAWWREQWAAEHPGKVEPDFLDCDETKPQRNGGKKVSTQPNLFR